MSKARTRMEKAMCRALAAAAVLVAAVGLALVWSAVADATPLRIPGIQLGVDPAAGPREVAGTLQILALLTVLSLAPAILLMMTSFTRIVIVLSFARSAMGTQQVPPNQVIIGLALFITLFVMMPVFADINETAWQPHVR